MSGGGDAPEEDKYAQDVQADIARDIYNDYVRRYYPEEMALAREIGDPAERATKLEGDLTRSAERVGKQYDVAELGLSRDLQRYGVTQRPDEAAATGRKMNLGRAASTVDALNRTRTASVDRTDQAMRDMVATGRGVSTSASGDATGAAQGEMQRNADAQAENARRQQQRHANIGTLIGGGAMLAISTRKAKKNIKTATSRDATEAIEKTKVRSFEYKPAIGGPRGKQIGPIAEEAPPEFRGPETKQGKTVNLGSMVGALVKNQQDLSKRIKKLETRK